MASTTDVVVAVERLLVHHGKEVHNVLASTIDSDDTTLTLTYDGTGIAKDTVLGCEYELMRVWERSDLSVTVERAEQGTTAAAHTAGARLVADPQFPRAHILAALNDELADLSSPLSGLFQVKTVDVTYDQGVYGYNLAADYIDRYEASWEPVSSTKGRRFLAPNAWEVKTGLDTADFASGVAVFLPAGISDGYAVRVRYMAAFSAITSATADVAATSGLPSTALDVLEYGAAIRLLAPLEPARNYTRSQGDSRRAEEVPPGAQGRSVAWLAQIRQERLNAEAARLRQLYPRRIR